MISYEPLFQTMREKKVSSYELDKRGFPRSTYYAIKHGKGITTNSINQLCSILHCSVSDVVNILKKNRSCLKNAGKIPLYDTVPQSGIWYLYLKISSLYALFTQKLMQFFQYALPAVLYGFSAAAVYFCRIRNSDPIKIKQFNQPGICIRQLS